MTLNQILDKLHSLANPEKVAFKAKKFAVITPNSLGIYHKDLKEMAKDIPKDEELAMKLFDTGIYEARLLSAKLFKPKNVTSEKAEKWIKVFDNWEICDSFCMGLIAKSSLAKSKILEWDKRKPEFEKRAAYATMAAYCMADKKAPNNIFEAFLPMIYNASTDERLYVKKAVNWALRSIGKRNIDLRAKALKCSYEILKQDNKAAQWIAKDAIKELKGENVRSSDYPRDVYR